MLGANGCSDQTEEPTDPTTDTPIISDTPVSPAEVQWFDQNIQSEACEVDFTFDLGSASHYLTAQVDIHNGGDLPIAYRDYPLEGVLACQRMTVQDDQSRHLLRTIQWAFVGGVVGTAQPQMAIVEPGEEWSQNNSITARNACTDVLQTLRDQRPSQWRICWGPVQLSSAYAPGGSQGVHIGDTRTLGKENLPPVLLCSPTADLPPDWYE